MVQISQHKQFKIYKADDCYILHNSALPNFRHTHLDSVRQCKLLITLSLKKQIPRHLSRYLLISLTRINDGEYAEKIEELLSNKKPKQAYVNSRRCS